MPASIILTALGSTLTGTALAVATFAINMVAASIVARVFAPNRPTNDSTATSLGSRATVPPAGDNKLPVVYGSAYVGGIVTDMSITSDSQVIYYCLALNEVTNTENGGTADVFTFGDIFYGGKKVIFDGTDLTKVVSLLDVSTGLSDTTVNGKMNFYLYRNGSSVPFNTSTNAVTIMSDPSLVYKWDGTKTMTNTVFAIVKLRYSETANIRGLESVRFQITNARTNTGDCISDYLFSERYGAALPAANIDSTSLAALTAYSNQIITYQTYDGGISATQARFKFDGVVNTNNTIMTNLQLMATSCDCLIKYNEITAQWGVIVQQPTYTVAMALDDSNIISGLSISPLDISNTFNIAEVKFPDGANQDTFASATFDLAQLNPSLLFPNEPVNKQDITLQFVNNNVRAQLLANRFLESCREDLQVQAKINYVGLQLEAGDIVTITNTNYGWSSKLFRITKITQEFGSDGTISASLSLMEFNPAVYDDANITEFTPSPNTGLGSPLTFGTLPVPTIGGLQPNAGVPSFNVNVTTSSAGIVQYAEIWYSAFASPTDDQRYFAGTTQVQSNGNPYDPSTAMPTVTLSGIPAGNWYFFSRMVNSLGKSNFSSNSSLLQWRPTTFTYTDQYLLVAYGDSLTGTGFSASPINKSYYGLANSASSTFSTNPADYTWYLAQPTFGSTIKLCFINRTGRLFSFGTAQAAYAAGTGAYVPATTFDNSAWSALPDGTNFIDLDIRTGQLTKTGTTTVGGGEIAITNNLNGTMVGSLAKFLDFGGAPTFTTTASSITIDVYGRVVGLIPPDNFYFSSEEFTATASQTVFTPTARQAGYITGQDWIFKNGILLTPISDYTETSTTVTLGVACTVGDKITIVSFRSTSSSVYYEHLDILYSSGSGTAVCTYSDLPYQTISAGDKLTFSDTGSPTQYTVSSINYATKQITFTGNFTATAGAVIYRYRASGSTYSTWSRFADTLSAASTYTPTTYQLVSGSEIVFINGTLLNDQDYDLVGNSLNNFPSSLTGDLVVYQFAASNFGVPSGSPAIVSTYTSIGQPTYSFSYDSSAFELYQNGCITISGSDYSTATGSYTLTPTPTNNTTVLSQQTFSRSGAA